ncbi:MAG: 4Fe-4S dicluster domain-containing protein [Candidatus Heimdallarchaeota archaeon]
MTISRRQFLKISAAGATGSVLALIGLKVSLDRIDSKKSSPQEEPSSSPQWGKIIDLESCDGCPQLDVPKCLEACAIMHYVPKRFKTSATGLEVETEDLPQQWIRHYQKEDNPYAGPYEFPTPCMHCDTPPCRDVCPVGATFKNKEGLVLIDHRTCIGCRSCMAACPYNARFFNWGEPEPWAGTREEELEFAKRLGGYTPEFPLPHEKGVVEKCDFCAHSAKNGSLPACVGGCPRGSIYFGDRNYDAATNGKGVTIPFIETTRERQAFRLHEELGTRPRVLYLPKK